MRGYGSRAYATSTQRFFMRARKLSGGEEARKLSQAGISSLCLH